MKSWTVVVLGISLVTGLNGAEAATAPIANTSPVSSIDATDVDPVFITSAEEVACEPTAKPAASTPTASRAAAAPRPRTVVRRPAAKVVARAPRARPAAVRRQLAQAPRARPAAAPAVRELAAVTSPTPAVQRCFVYRRDRLIHASLPLAPTEFVPQRQPVLFRPDLPNYFPAASPARDFAPEAESISNCDRILAAQAAGVSLSPEDAAAGAECGGGGGGTPEGGGPPGGGPPGGGPPGGGPPGDTTPPGGGPPGDTSPPGEPNPPGGPGEPPVVAAAPEPSTWSLMITGVGLAGLALRRRREQALAAAYARSQA